MISERAKFAFVGLLVLLGPALAVWVRKDNARLRREVTELRRQDGQLLQLRKENSRLRELADRLRRASDPATAAHAGKADGVEDERHRDGHQPGADERAAVIAANRDPEKDFVLIENYRDAGRATPSAAFQTLVRAAAMGDDRTLAGLLTFDPQVRQQLEDRIAALPAPAREKYPTPESLAALFFSELVTGHTRPGCSRRIRPIRSTHR
jgi:hypothetical protein